MTPGEHPAADVLLGHWLHEHDDATTDAIDAHLMQCEACGAQLEQLIALRDGVRDAFAAGLVTTVASGAFVQRLAGQGGRVREYRLPHNGSVHCTVAPDDDLLVSRLAAPLSGITRLDAEARLSLAPEAAPKQWHDIPFDAEAGEVVYLPPIAAVRAMPAYTLQVTLLAVSPEGRRELGRYTFHHRPWPATPDP